MGSNFLEKVEAEKVTHNGAKRGHDDHWEYHRGAPGPLEDDKIKTTTITIKTQLVIQHATGPLARRIVVVSVFLLIVNIAVSGCKLVMYEASDQVASHMQCCQISMRNVAFAALANSNGTHNPLEPNQEHHTDVCHIVRPR